MKFDAMRRLKRDRARVGQEAALLAASRAVNSALGLDEGLQLVLRSAKDLCRADEGSVMLLEEDYLKIRVGDGIPKEAFLSKVALGQGISGHVAQSGRPVMISGRANEAHFNSLIANARPLHSALCLPLRAAGKTVGVLNLNVTSEGRVFKEADLHLAEIFAEHAALAIHKAQLLESANLRSSDLGLLVDASEGLMGALDLDLLLNQMLTASLKLLQFESGFIFLVNDESGLVQSNVCSGIDPESVFQALGAGVAGTFKAEAPTEILIADSPALAGLAGSSEAAVVCSIPAEGPTRALLALFGPRTEAKSLGLLQTFLGQAGLATRNAQLYRQVEEKQSEFSSVLSSMTEPILVVDPAGIVLIANPAAEELFGFSVSFTEGRPVAGLLGSQDLEALARGERTEPVQLQLGEGTQRLWRARASLFQTAGAGVKGRVLVLHDMTKETDAERVKSEFVSVIGHEFRTPLTLIKGYVATLLGRGDRLNEDQRRDSLTTIHSQTGRLERMIEDLLYMSSVERTSPPLHLEQVDLPETVRGVIKEFQALSPGREFALAAPIELTIGLDRVKIEQIVHHLIDNACKFSDETTPVRVEISDGEAEVTISVVDQGSGILPRDLPSIFDRFHQLDSTATRSVGGSGVGLYVCKSMVEAHGGKISVDSTWHKGSTFKFTIPKRQAVADLS